MQDGVSWVLRSLGAKREQRSKIETGFQALVTDTKQNWMTDLIAMIGTRLKSVVLELDLDLSLSLNLSLRIENAILLMQLARETVTATGKQIADFY